MELHFVGTANVFVFCPCLKEVRFALDRCVDGNVAHPVDGMFILQLNCRCTLMPLPSKT